MNWINTLVLVSSLMICVAFNVDYNHFNKEIKISRDREELLGKAIKQLAYEQDVVTQSFLKETRQ